MASVEAVAASEAALEAAVDLSMTWIRCPDGSAAAAAAAAAGSTLAGIVALASSHLLYELSFVSPSSSGLQQTDGQTDRRTDRQTDGQTDRQTERQTDEKFKLRRLLLGTSSAKITSS